MKARVALHGAALRTVLIDTAATNGATIGTNVWNADGTLFVPGSVATPAADSHDSVVIWQRVLQIPANVKALELAAGTVGLFAVTGSGTGALRTLQPVAGETTVANGGGVAGDPAVGLADLANSGAGALLAITRDAKGRVSGTKAATITGTAGRITVANGDGVAGLPTLDLATVADGGGGTLLRIVRDAWGRITGTSAATTDDLPEAATPTNLYHSTARARAAAVADSLTDGVLDVAPSQNAVVDALAAKTSHADMFADHVVSGLLSPTSANLSSTLAAGTAYVTGLRVVKAAEAFTYAASSDTYEDMASTGVITRTAVANGGAVPAVTANTLRLQKVVTDAAAVTAVTRLAQTSALFTQTITNGDTTHAPSGDAVFDALALKADGAGVTVASGTYTPTATLGTNAAGVTVSQWQWLRVGNTVTASGRVDISCTTAADTLTSVLLSLPVASNLGAGTNLAGAGGMGYTPYAAALVIGDAAGDRANLQFHCKATGSTAGFFTFTYVII